MICIIDCLVHREDPRAFAIRDEIMKRQGQSTLTLILLLYPTHTYYNRTICYLLCRDAGYVYPARGQPGVGLLRRGGGPHLHTPRLAQLVRRLQITPQFALKYALIQLYFL